MRLMPQFKFEKDTKRKINCQHFQCFHYSSPFIIIFLQEENHCHANVQIGFYQKTYNAIL